MKIDKTKLEARCRRALRNGYAIGKGEHYANELIKELGMDVAVPFPKGSPAHLLALLQAKPTKNNFTPMEEQTKPDVPKAKKVSKSVSSKAKSNNDKAKKSVPSKEGTVKKTIKKTSK